MVQLHNTNEIIMQRAAQSGGAVASEPRAQNTSTRWKDMLPGLCYDADMMMMMMT